MTFIERVQALAPLGFSEVQTRFLVTVALHSGFCLRRHYTAFAGLKYGQGVRDFLERLVARKLARRFAFRPDRGHVYHLHASSIYEAIGQGDNRNRRPSSPALIARKLMLLDYVLTQPDVDWFATEQDKVRLFTTQYGIDRADLPQHVYLAGDGRGSSTTRYFVDKLPLFRAGDPPVVSFVFLVTDTTGSGLTRFLHDHVRLFRRLPDWRVIALAPRHIPGLLACSAAFQRAFVDLPKPQASEDTARLQAYFRVRDLIERNELWTLTVKEIDEFRDSKRRFAGPQFEARYRRWKAEGPSVLKGRASEPVTPAVAERRGSLVMHQLPVRYDRFGTRAGVS